MTTQHADGARRPYSWQKGAARSGEARKEEVGFRGAVAGWRAAWPRGLAPARAASASALCPHPPAGRARLRGKRTSKSSTRPSSPWTGTAPRSAGTCRR
eukprot:4035254-Prymnesium_polylepis.1